MRETLREVVSTLEGIEDELPRLDRRELESRLGDLVHDARSLMDGTLGDIAQGLEDLASALDALYYAV